METVTLEMWTVNLDGSMGDTHLRVYPANRRRHDMLRDLASFALATPNGVEYIRPRRSDICVNSAQGVAWLKDNPAHIAYFRN